MLRAIVKPTADGRIGARFSPIGSNMEETSRCLIDQDLQALPFVSHVQADGPAACSGLAVGDFLEAIDGTAISTVEHAAGVLQLAIRRAIASGEEGITIDVRRSSMVPNERAFSQYCEDYPHSRADVCFQAKHQTIGGWCVQGCAALDKAMVLPCDGCPECLIGEPFSLLDAAALRDPKILRWASRPEWLRRGAWRPPKAEPRFRPGERVLLYDGEATGVLATITQLHHSEPGWPEGFSVPYAVECDDGVMRYVPFDMEEYVQLAQDRAAEGKPKKQRR